VSCGFGVLLAASVVGAAASVVHAAAGSITAIPIGGTLSGDGATVAGTYLSGSFQEPVIWTASGGVLPLTNGLNGTATGASFDGSAVAGRAGQIGGPTQAFRWTEATGSVGLGYLLGGTGNSSAFGISADGTTVVGDSSFSNAREAFRWTQGVGMVGLGDLAGGTLTSSARAASADGSVVVGYGTTDDGFEAFRWTEDSGMAGLGDLPGGAIDSEATDVSADGAVVVGSSEAATGREAFFWRQGTGMVGLGLLALGSENLPTFANSVSADGSVVVGNGVSSNRPDPFDNGGEAFVWTPGGGMSRLWDVLLSAGVDPAANGWTFLYNAYSINSDGTTISGTGVHNGNFEAFVAVIPEPIGIGFGGGAAVIAGLTLTGRRRRR
jgi:probable HAF family extracellular repeat protein